MYIHNYSLFIQISCSKSILLESTQLYFTRIQHNRILTGIYLKSNNIHILQKLLCHDWDWRLFLLDQHRSGACDIIFWNYHSCHHVLRNVRRPFRSKAFLTSSLQNAAWTRNVQLPWRTGRFASKFSWKFQRNHCIFHLPSTFHSFHTTPKCCS